MIINIIINIFFLFVFFNDSKIKKEIIYLKKKIDFHNNIVKDDIPYNDKEMIGLKYPEINFEKFRANFQNFFNIKPLLDLINQLEIKLEYLEKEINVTKLVTFFNSRKLYLKDNNVTYDENNLKELHEIINWIIIHKSDQLKGIASDKYLACKYVQLKIGKNMCKQRYK